MAEKYVQTLERALDILEVLAQADDPLGVTEIGTRIALHKSTVHRILQTLCYRGYVEKEMEHERYKLGIKVLELGIGFLNDMEIRFIAGPILEELAKSLNEVANLVLLDEGEVVYIDKRESSHVVSMHAKVGRRAPMHCTAVGKALLATMSDQEVRRILEKKGMPRFTPNTIVDPDKLLTDLDQIRKSGISIEYEENEIGIICLGTSVYDFSGRSIGAISVSGPAARIQEKGIERISTELKRAGEKISEKMGFKFSS